MYKVSRGFTLIELMIVIAIIGVLAAIAVPAYLNYVKRAQVVEGFNLINGLKSPMIEYYIQNNQCPDNSNGSSGGIDLLTRIKGAYVEKVQVGLFGSASKYKKCLIRAWFYKDKIMSGYHYVTIVMDFSVTPNVWTGVAKAGAYTWTCTSTLKQVYLPNSCEGK